MTLYLKLVPAMVTTCVLATSSLSAQSLPYPGAGPYPPAGDTPGNVSISASDSRIVEWASTVVSYLPGKDVIPDPTGNGTEPYPTYNNSALALGPADCTYNDPYEVVSLGDGGSITLGFAKPITNGPGTDFAVYTNKFKKSDGVPNDYFLELAYVAVSSDGVNFFTFPSVSLTQTTTQVGGFGLLDPTNIYDLAGKDISGYGTPFSLQELAGISPLLDVNHIIQIRITDVVGSINPTYASYDSKGNIINAPYPTPFGSSGFSLDAIAVLSDTDTYPVTDTPTMPPVALLIMALLLLLAARQTHQSNSSDFRTFLT